MDRTMELIDNRILTILKEGPDPINIARMDELIHLKENIVEEAKRNGKS